MAKVLKNLKISKLFQINFNIACYCCANGVKNKFPLCFLVCQYLFGTLFLF